MGAIGQLLPEAEAQPKSEAARRAEQLGREAMYIGSCLAAGIPRHTRTLYCLKLQEAGPEHSRAPPALWAQMTLAMALTPAQKQVGVPGLRRVMELGMRVTMWLLCAHQLVTVPCCPSLPYCVSTVSQWSVPFWSWRHASGRAAVLALSWSHFVLCMHILLEGQICTAVPAQILQSFGDLAPARAAAIWQPSVDV